VLGLATAFLVTLLAVALLGHCVVSGDTEQTDASGCQSLESSLPGDRHSEELRKIIELFSVHGR
jgi:hypothetical protein